MSFYSNIARYYDRIFPLNTAQLEFVLNHGKNKDTVLDVGAATGKLSMELMEQGRQAVGIDLDPELVAIGRKRACCGVKILQLDMLTIEDKFGSGYFDQIICFGNTLVHLPTNDAVFDFFRQSKTCLENGGRFACQIINYDRILDQAIDSLPTIDNEYLRFERKYRIREDRQIIDFDTVLLDKQSGKSIVNSQPLLALRKSAIEAMLLEAGFTTFNFYSSFHKTAYDADAQPLIFEAFQ